MFLINYPLLRHRSSGYGWTEREEETQMSYTSAGDTLGSVAVISCVVCWNIQGRDLPYVLCLYLRYQLIRWGHLIMDFFFVRHITNLDGGSIIQVIKQSQCRCTQVYRGPRPHDGNQVFKVAHDACRNLTKHCARIQRKQQFDSNMNQKRLLTSKRVT